MDSQNKSHNNEFVKGEINKKITELRERGIDVSDLIYKFKDDTTNIELWHKDEPYIKLYVGSVRSTLDILKQHEISALLKLVPFICYGTGLLCGENNRPLGLAEIESILGLEERQVRRILKKLLNQNIIIKCKNNEFEGLYVNPYLFFKGKFINKTLASMFKKYKLM